MSTIALAAEVSGFGSVRMTFERHLSKNRMVPLWTPVSVEVIGSTGKRERTVQVAGPA
jgi:hypothetical protein